MRRDRGADIWASAVHDVEHAFRQPGFATNLAEQIRRHRCQLARLRNGSIADCDSRRDFPAQQIERQVPRRNQSRDAARLTQRVVERDIVGDVRFRFGVQDRGREEAEIAGGAWNVERSRKRERLPRIDRLSSRDLFEIALDQIGDAQKNPRPLLRRRARPIRERLLRRGHGKIDIAAVAVRGLRIRLSRRWLNVVQIFSTERPNKLAVDEILNLEWLSAHGMWKSKHMLESSRMRGHIRQHARRVRSPEKIVVAEKGSFVINSESWRTMPRSAPTGRPKTERSQ